MKKIILFLFFSVSLLSAQSGVRQITNFTFDVEHPSFVNYIPGGFETFPDLFFEVHNQDSVNIAQLTYNTITDKFENLTYITHDEFINKNQDVYFNPNGYLIAMWETNRNGNFDIAYSKFENESWQQVQLATETAADERNVSFVKNQGYPYCDCAFAVYERSGSVFIKDVLNSAISEDTVFSAYGDIHFSQPVAMNSPYYSSSNTLFCAAIRDSADSEFNLVYKIKFNSENWSELQTINLIGVQSNPHFDNFGNLIFDNTVDGKSSVYIIQFLEMNTTPEEVFSDSIDSFFNFRNLSLMIITKGINDYYPMPPYVIQRKSAETDSVIFTQDYLRDTSVVVNITSPQPNVGNLALVNSCYVVYTVWVDSVNGMKNIYGSKQLIDIGAVDDNGINVDNFKLSQNYPNPFFAKGSTGEEAVTTIKFTVPDYAGGKNLSKVTLSVYDILGRRISTLVNGHKTPGEYSVKFNALDLPSGIYFYSLRSGNFSVTKKMIFIR
jgi:hypothetical protein